MPQKGVIPPQFRARIAKEEADKKARERGGAAGRVPNHPGRMPAHHAHRALMAAAKHVHTMPAPPKPKPGDAQDAAEYGNMNDERPSLMLRSDQFPPAADMQPGQMHTLVLHGHVEHKASGAAGGKEHHRVRFRVHQIGHATGGPDVEGPAEDAAEGGNEAGGQ